MTASALTRPGERERLSVKLTQIDWRFTGLLCVVAGIGALMLYSVAKGSWEPWAAKHLIRFGVLLVVMLLLSMVHLKWWFRVSYPVYGLALLMLALIGLTFHHIAAGLQVVVEDYVKPEARRIAVLLVIKALCWLAALISGFSVLRVAFT